MRLGSQINDNNVTQSIDKGAQTNEQSKKLRETNIISRKFCSSSVFMVLSSPVINREVSQWFVLQRTMGCCFMARGLMISQTEWPLAICTSMWSSAYSSLGRLTCAT